MTIDSAKNPVPKLVLSFYRTPAPQLAACFFSHPRWQQQRYSWRGKSRGNGSSSFEWTAAPRALASLLIKTAAWRATAAPASPPALSGMAGTPAASLDYALSKQPRWLFSIFGSAAHGHAAARRLIVRQNAERRHPGPVSLSVNTGFLPPECIEIFVDDCRVSEPALLNRMAEEILE